MVRSDKVNIKASSTRRKTPSTTTTKDRSMFELYKHWNNVKWILIIGGKAKTKTTGLDACSKIFQKFLKALEQGKKIFQKFEESKLLKKTRKHLFINDTGKYWKVTNKKSHHTSNIWRVGGGSTRSCFY